MKYKEVFDHLGNPHYAKITDREGIFIAVVMVAIVLLTWVWSN
jgi:hypothetical protein